MAEAGLALQHAFPDYANAGWFGEIFFSQSWFTYLGVVVAIAAAIIIKYTRVGLNLRAVGENAAAADNAGINVARYRYIATIIGGAIAGIGGAFYELDNVKGMFNVADGVDAFGWLALCIVIFSLWRPMLAVGASFVFAALVFSSFAVSCAVSILSAVPLFSLPVAPSISLSFFFAVFPAVFLVSLLIGNPPFLFQFRFLFAVFRNESRKPYIVIGKQHAVLFSKPQCVLSCAPRYRAPR